MKKMLKRLCTGFLALATVVTTLPTTPVHAESKQYWTESKERVGIVEKVMNDGSIGSTFNEGHLTVEGEDAYCIDINTDFRNGYKTRIDASTRMSADQISDVSLLGTVAHATGLVDDTINAENLYSKYPLSNYQLDFFVDNSWSWLPWNWLDGIGKSVQYGLYCITNFVWTISLYLSNATGYVVQEAYKLDFILC